MRNIRAFAHMLMEEEFPADGVVADFTMGNGNDTLFLAQHMPQGRIYAFDIQKQAVENTRQKLTEQEITNVTLIHDSHSNMTEYIKEELDGGVFNLGYLPGGDKTVTTMTETTVKAVSDAVGLLKISGVLVINVYPGHEEGAREEKALDALLKGLPSPKYDVVIYRLINKIDEGAPFVYAVERRK